MISLDPKTTALVLIDLQKGILTMPVLPHTSQGVLEKGMTLAGSARAAGSPVVLVHVGFAPDFADAPPGIVDQPPGVASPLPDDWTSFAPGLRQPSDLVVLKRQWGAFTGTDLDLQLRRRGIRTIVLAGIATNLGVESTLRHAWELGYDVVVPEDACTSLSEALHRMAFTHIFPRLCRVTRTNEIVFGE
ncbi:hydrolase [Swaminathania salitolerans]|uniref:Hydrolase n=1 Tax=Swaminathania salitolerans TaxID=182838 RepID=A0A511BRK5_9PROT|nr:hydrolase [Swaminathania salitolerans]GBQ14268.1 isochorismatase hydrolase [Swaminathania salitolerans LMG 21291]GEL02971.1 hydrolase [Swaminathania salitolerans]